MIPPYPNAFFLIRGSLQAGTVIIEMEFQSGHRLFTMTRSAAGQTVILTDELDFRQYVLGACRCVETPRVILIWRGILALGRPVWHITIGRGADLTVRSMETWVVVAIIRRPAFKLRAFLSRVARRRRVVVSAGADVSFMVLIAACLEEIFEVLLRDADHVESSDRAAMLQSRLSGAGPVGNLPPGPRRD